MNSTGFNIRRVRFSVPVTRFPNSITGPLKRTLLVFILIGAAHCLAADIEWPAMTPQTKPGARWWWLGNIGTDQDFTIQMEKYAKANLGNLELTPIYGVKGEEDKFVQYLSPQWVARLKHITDEGKRLGINIDMSMGNGWPFGGPWVTPDDACKTLLYKTFTVKAGEKVSEPVAMTQEPFYQAIDFKGDVSELKDPVGSNANLQQMGLEQVVFARKLPLNALMAYSDGGQIIDLTSKVAADGKLDWTAPAGNWTLYAIFLGWHGKLVERAGPGAEGDVIDHMSSKALLDHLAQFDKAFAGSGIKLRAYFCDSYEVDDAIKTQHNWTPKFFEEFSKRRGYDLRQHLPELLSPDQGRSETAARVVSDYRETVSDLMLEEYAQVWAKWAADHGSLIRYQAHGSPANVFDLYAAAGIPETEGGQTLRSKIASSAAHVSGKQLASSESATWLGGHFTATLAQVKAIADRFLLGGVNHIFYHGMAFSPPDEPWPGFMFYAGAEFNPNNSWWDDFAALNMYVARCQSFLQSGKPDEQILVFDSIYDQWGGIATAGGRGRGGRGGGGGGAPPGAGGTLPLSHAGEGQAGVVGAALNSEGYSFDYISDRYLAGTSFTDGALETGGNKYRVIVVPQAQMIPVASMEKLIALARAGAKIVVQNHLPADVPGLGNLDERRKHLNDLLATIKFESPVNGIQMAQVGQGRFLMGANLNDLLRSAIGEPESMVAQGLSYIRRVSDGGGSVYFIVNNGNAPFDGWVRPAGGSYRIQATVIFNPMTGQIGRSPRRPPEGGIISPDFYLQLQPGESVIVRTYPAQVDGPMYSYWKPASDPQPMTGSWSLRFIKGGPTLPKTVQMTELKSWTELDDAAYKNFSGTATYSLSFPRPANADGWTLDLGNVRDSARVSVNGKEIGTLIQAPYQLTITPDMLHDGNNTLEVAVSNQMINRAEELDREGVNWRRFYNDNVQRAPSFANNPPLPSGLIGPVKLVPLSKLNPN